MPFITYSQNPLSGTPTLFFFYFFNGIWSLCSSASLFLFMLFIHLLWLSWVFTGERRLSLVASQGYSSLTVCGFLGEVASLVKPRP